MVKLPKFCLLVDAFHEQPVGRHAAFLEGVRILAVEEHDRAGRRLLAEGGALAAGLLERGDDVAFVADDLQRAVLDSRLAAAFVRKRCDAVLGLAVGLDLLLAVPAFAGQAADVAHGVELAVALGDDLYADFRRAVLAGHFARVLALHGEVGAGLGRIGHALLQFGRRRRHGHDHHQHRYCQ